MIKIYNKSIFILLLCARKEMCSKSFYYVEKSENNNGSEEKNMDNSKLSLREKICYGAGDVSANLIYTTASTYLIFFWTTVYGISAAATATLSLAVGIWDAVFNPVMGIIADRTKSRWGSYRPWLLWGSVPLGIFSTLCFMTPKLGDGGKLVWAYVVFFGMKSFFSAVNVPYGVMRNVMTPDISERMSLSTYKNMGSDVANIFGAYCLLPLVTFLGKGVETDGYFKAAALLGVIGFACLMLTFAGCKERLVQPKENMPLRESVRSLKGNKAAVIMMLVMLVMNTAVIFKFGFNAYYCAYYLNNEAVIGITAAIAFAVGLVSKPLVPIVSDKIGKKGTLIFGCFIMIADGGVFYFGGVSVAAVYLGAVLFGLTLTFTFTPIWGMVPDSIEYGEWTSGVRAPGFIYSTATFANKLGVAISGWLIGVVLAATGFDGMAEVQAASVAPAVQIAMTAVLVVGGIVTIVLLIPYDLNSEKYDKIMKEIADRKNAA